MQEVVGERGEYVPSSASSSSSSSSSRPASSSSSWYLLSASRSVSEVSSIIVMRCSSACRYVSARRLQFVTAFAMRLSNLHANESAMVTA